MTEAQWKLVVDQQGVTIASDKFQFTTTGTRQDAELDFDEQLGMNSSESSYMEAVIAELQSMTRRTYGQYCGVGRALEIIGERWTILFVRDLLLGPKSLQELHQGLPAVSSEILTARLAELEHFGVVKQAPDEDGETRYRLTVFGRELETIIMQLSLWGSRLLGEPRPEDVVTVDVVRLALKATFQPKAAAGLKVSYQLNLGDIVVHAKIDDGEIETGEGPLPGADLVLDDAGTSFKRMLGGEISAAEALETGSLKVFGDPALLATFTELFKIPPRPEED
jgi:DNA-binding HxlR family transcriptional regulator